MKKQLVWGLVALAACGGRSQAADESPPAPPHTIRVALPESGLEGDRIGLEAFRVVVESVSNGRLDVMVRRARESCGRPVDCVSAMSAGHIDVYPATLDDVVALVPELQVLSVPFLIESDGVIERIFAGPFSTRIATTIADKTELQLMATSHGGGWRGIANRVRPIRVPDDARSLTLSTSGAPVRLELVRALGATPLLAEDPTDASGAADVDGATIGLLVLAERADAPHFSYLTLDRHSYDPRLWLMSTRSYAALPADLQRVLRGGFDELQRLTFGFPNDDEATAMAALRSAGVAIHEPEPAERRAFVMAGGRVSTWFMDAHGADWLVWLEEAIAEAEQQVGRGR